MFRWVQESVPDLQDDLGCSICTASTDDHGLQDAAEAVVQLQLQQHLGCGHSTCVDGRQLLNGRPSQYQASLQCQVNEAQSVFRRQPVYMS